MSEPQDRSLLYLRTRETLKSLDPNLDRITLACLARAVVRDGLAFMNREGRVVLVTSENDR